ncbi:MAG: hypothetical protein SOV27_04950 [Eubacteriales bacterium]|nr:hypothetical protein [Clostridia bacterium]MDY2696491.1 hypothetical protein [Eubacteriales bacterium]
MEKNISNKGLMNISAFMSSCDDLINGKFIFAGNKVANILKAISESPELYEVISECLKNFNYEKEFGRAKIKLPTKKGTFKMPEDKTILIPMVFCMLVEIQENKIDFKQFLADYFDTDDEDVSQFENFANTVIVPFKNAIAYLFEIEGQNKFKPQEEKKEEPKLLKKEPQVTDKQAEFFNDIKNIISDILDNMEFIKIKPEISDDLKYMLKALKQEVEAKNIKTTNALIIGTIYTLKQVRKLRRYESNFRDALEELYL